MSTIAICGVLIIGTTVSLGLVLVSPNMTYPKIVAAGAKAQVTSIEKKQGDGLTLTDKEKGELEKARKTFEANKNGKSMMGLDAPLFTLRNPGIVSIPIGFLSAVILAFLFPNKKEEDKFDEMYVRQTTGMGMSELIGG